MITPSELGAELRVDAKAIRRFLRMSFRRSPAEHGQRWDLDDRTADAVRAHFGDGS